MALDDRFAKTLKKSNAKIYDKINIGESVLYKWFVEYKLEEDD